MKNLKAYFVTSDNEEVYELSASKKNKLDKLHPRWEEFDCEKNYEELGEVYKFVKENGKLVGHPSFKNVFVGLIE